MGQRIDVALEGVTTSDGRHILPGALRFHHDPVPVTYRDSEDDEYGSRLVGRADRFRRDKNVISAEITLHEPLDLDRLNRHIETIVDLWYEDEIHLGTIRGIFLSTGPSAWPQLNVVKEG